MKKSFFRFVLPCAMMLGAMTGCNKSEDKTESLSIKPETIAFEKDAADKNFVVESNVPWRITCSDTWFSVTPIAGSGNRNVTLSVTANKTDSPRTGTVTVKTTEGGMEKTLQVTQSGSDPFINLFGKTSVSSDGGDVTVTVDASSSWTILMPNNASWLTKKSQKETEAVFNVDENTEYEPRTAIITFKLDATGETKTFTLTQLKLGVWEDVTERVGLQNTGPGFAHGGIPGLNANILNLTGWKANKEDVKILGNVVIVDNPSTLYLFNYGTDTSPVSIIDGHLYQTVYLDAGLYRWDTECINNYTGNPSANPNNYLYFGAAMGSDLPNIGEDPSDYLSNEMLLGCTRIHGTHTANPDEGRIGQGLHQVYFEVTEAGNVSLGLIAYYLADDINYFGFTYFELWKYE